MRRALRLLSISAALLLLSRPVAAHAGSLSGTLRSTPVPSWLLTLTGAGIIGASFLFTSLFTDHETIRAVNDSRRLLPSPATVRRAGQWLLRAVGVVGLLLVVVSGLAGTQAAAGSFAVLVVWAGWWAGYTMSVYLVGNTWPALNPWRTLADLLPRLGDRSYPDLGKWPAVAGLVALVWIEVVSPVAESPRLLAGLVVGYSVVTLVGASVYGADTWFGTVDPIALVFRYYGRLAPFQRTDEGITLRLPGAALVDATEPESPDGTAFVVALLWVTTFDGFVTTPAWAALARPVVGVGVPALLLYAVAMLAGLGLFFAVYRVVSGWARGTADAYVAPGFIEGWFAPALLPIAAGYHLAHFLGFFLSLSPALVTVLTNPFAAPATVDVAVLPGWFGGIQLAFIVLGHLLAVWVAHALSFEVFTGRLQPIRSQYPFILVMVLYTATSMWIVSQPFTQPPFL